MQVTAGDGERGGCLGRLLGVSVALVVIIGAAVWLGVRTDGARELVQNWLSRRLGAELAIGGARIGWPYDMVISGLHTVGFPGDGVPGFSTATMRLGVRARGRLIAIDGCRVRLHADAQGHWAPAALAPLGGFPGRGIEAVTAMATGICTRSHLIVRSADVQWLSADGHEIASASNATLRVTPITVPGRVLWHYRFEASRMSGIGDPELANVRWEWMAAGEAGCLPLEVLPRPGALDPPAAPDGAAEKGDAR